MKIVRKMKKNYDFYNEIKFLEGPHPPSNKIIIQRKNLMANFADQKFTKFFHNHNKFSTFDYKYDNNINMEKYEN